jgi:DNA processing protein
MSDVITDIGRSYLRWALTDGVGPLTFSRLLIQLGDVETALGASVGMLETVKNIGGPSAARIARSRDSAPVDDEIQLARQHDVRIICRADAEYPEGLKQIPDAPIVIYVRGTLRPTDAVSIAIVGSRRCTIYGSEQARRFGELLAGAGFTIVSGLARGVDAFAHHGAVDADGRTIAVMGRGLTEIYPPENAALADRLLANGAWVCELPLSTAVRAQNFPSRNRIIAGMTLGTVVIEAAKRSGALITARLASEYNREVFAVPGRVQDDMSRGTNALIRDGYAKLVTDLDDVLAELPDVAAALRPASSSSAVADDAPAPSGSPARLNAAEQRVLSVIGYDPIMRDVVLTAAELPPGVVLAALTALELKGLVTTLPGNLVVRRGRA